MEYFIDKIFRSLKREKKLCVNKNLRMGLNKSGYPLPIKCNNYRCKKYKDRYLNDI